MSPPPPPPPLPPPPLNKASSVQVPDPPTVAPDGPQGAFLVELLVYNGSPFKDHWAYFVRSQGSAAKGVKVHATGDVRNGFSFEIKRSVDLQDSEERPSKRIPLQWVEAQYFDENAMLNNGVYKLDAAPVCLFEESASKIKAPVKSLNTVNDEEMPVRRVVQKNCQSWIVESADQIVEDHIFNKEVAAYLSAIEQK